MLTTERGELCVTVSTDSEGFPIEVFGRMGKAGSFEHGVTELACRLITLALRSGASARDIVAECQGISEMQPFPNRLGAGGNGDGPGSRGRHRSRAEAPPRRCARRTSKERRRDMRTVDKRSETFDRPAASFAGDGSLEVRGSAAAGCRPRAVVRGDGA